VTDLAAALIASLDAEALDALADQLAPRLAGRLAADAPEPDRWLDTRGAADHLALSVHALHRLSADRRIPASQDKPGGRLYFKRSELDRWRRDGRR